MSFGLKKHHWEERKSINRSFLSWCWMWFLLSNHSIFDCKLNYYYIIDLVIWCRLVSDLFILFKLLIPSKPNLQSAHIFIIYWVLAVKLEKRYMMSLCWDVLMKPWQRGLFYGLLGGAPHCCWLSPSQGGGRYRPSSPELHTSEYVIYISDWLLWKGCLLKIMRY